MPSAASVLRLDTSLRSRPSTETAEVADKLRHRLGVTHVLNVTQLDHLGLPVFMSLRPAGQLAQVHSGKGMSPEDAFTGALMEAVEYAACESASASAEVQRLSLTALRQQWPAGLDLADFAPLLGVVHTPRTRMHSVTCELLQARRHLPLPAELVLMPAPRQRGERLFGSSSNGLASGNTLEEATLHALLEVIERDTVALHIARDGSRALITSSLPQPFDTLSRAWRRRGVWLHVRYLPNDMGLPCFEAGFHEPNATLASTVLSRGWGLHFDRRIALSRAICEAAQSRLSVILANRPEIPGSVEVARRVGLPPSAEKTSRRLAHLVDRRRRIGLEAVPDVAPPSIREALRSLISRLSAAGLGPVFRYRLNPAGDPGALKGLNVVKVVVARSETPIGEHPRVGPRLMARLQGR